MFGPDDNFVMMFGRLIGMFPVVPVFGPEARLQPLYVDDAAEAIANALADPLVHGGKTYEIAGPEVLTMLELNRRIAAAEGRSRSLIALPDSVGGLFAATTGWLPGAPITSDQYALLTAGSVASGELPGLAELGVEPRPLGLFVDRWMVQFRRHGRFGTKHAA
jgi:NADH dehydrogenase